MDKISKEQRACIAWEVLIDSAKKKEYITYKGLGDQIGIHHRSVRFTLGLIQDYCMENKLPPLTILVVNKSTGKPGDGFIALDIDDSEYGVKKVHNYNWTRLNNPFSYANEGVLKDYLVTKLIERPDLSSDVYAKIKVRGTSQKVFREALLRVYDSSCCICGLTFDNALEACHIIPYSKSNSQQRLDIRNGLLLCANHHKMFDNGDITINQDYTIEYFDIEENKGVHSDYDRLMSIDFNGKKINLPSQNNHRPRLEYLLKHQNTFK